jgi:hypothetical protein
MLIDICLSPSVKPQTPLVYFRYVLKISNAACLTTHESQTGPNAGTPRDSMP